MEVNINNKVWVRLNERGEKIWADHWNRFGNHPEGVPAACRHTDSEGRTEFQIWELASIFGPHLYLGATVPFDTNIVIEKK